MTPADHNIKVGTTSLTAGAVSTGMAVPLWLAGRAMDRSNSIHVN